MRNTSDTVAGLVAAAVAAWVCGAGHAGWAQSKSAVLLTPAQYENDALALSVRNDPAVVAARKDLLTLWAGLPQNDVPDGRATLQEAADQVVYMALRSAAADPSRPQVIWEEAPAYTIGKLHVPSARLGDGPDRIYRFAALDPQYRYVIHGKRGVQPSLSDFSFEATGAPLAFGKALSHLSSNDIDIAADGSFTVTADASVAPGQRNHLSLPPGTTDMLIRDTLLDWGKQSPNTLSIERVGGEAAPPRSKAAVAQEAALEITQSASANLPFLKLGLKAPPNQITPFVRPLAYGMPGSGLAVNQFSVKKGEALVVTLDPLGGRYLGVAVGDPWQRTVAYWNHTGSLNNTQAKPNADGSITYVIAAKDPGVANWLDTGGLVDGVIIIRWEGLPAGADMKKALKSAQLVPVGTLATALPDAVRVGSGERKRILAERQAGFARRVSLD